MWQSLGNKEEFDELLNQSKNSKSDFLVFKHSYRCGFSSMIKRRFEKEFSSNLIVHEVDVVKDKSLSNYIADQFSIQHESPQIILFKSGEPIFHDSHSGVNADNLTPHLSA